MRKHISKRVWLIICVGAAFALVFLGLVISPWFWLALPIGLGVAGALRRLVLISEQDEFHLAAENEAAWYAFITALVLGGLFYCLERTGFSLGSAAVDRLLVTLEASATVYAAIYLFRFHDGRLAARILLFAIGAGLALFVVLSGWGDVLGTLISFSIIVLPFIALGFLAGRFPRATAPFCFAASITAAVFFHAYDLQRASSYFVIALICLPLIASGIGLLVTRVKEGESE